MCFGLFNIKKKQKTELPCWDVFSGKPENFPPVFQSFYTWNYSLASCIRSSYTHTHTSTDSERQKRIDVIPVSQSVLLGVHG